MIRNLIFGYNYCFSQTKVTSLHLFGLLNLDPRDPAKQTNLLENFR